MQKKKNHYDYENNKIWENDLPCHVNLISHHHDVFLIVFYILLFHVIISIVGILWKTWIPADQTLFRGQTSAECLPENLQWKIWTERLHCNCHFLIAVSKRWMVILKPFFLGGGGFFHLLENQLCKQDHDQENPRIWNNILWRNVKYFDSISF